MSSEEDGWTPTTWFEAHMRIVTWESQPPLCADGPTGARDFATWAPMLVGESL